MNMFTMAELVVNPALLVHSGEVVEPTPCTNHVITLVVMDTEGHELLCSVV